MYLCVNVCVSVCVFSFFLTDIAVVMSDVFSVVPNMVVDVFPCAFVVHSIYKFFLMHKYM